VNAYENVYGTVEVDPATLTGEPKLPVNPNVSALVSLLRLCTVPYIVAVVSVIPSAAGLVVTVGGVMVGVVATTVADMTRLSESLIVQPVITVGGLHTTASEGRGKKITAERATRAQRPVNEATERIM
jgi:hypothetical protein